MLGTAEVWGTLAGWESAHPRIVAKGMARGRGGASAETGFRVFIDTVTGPANERGTQAPGSGAAPQTAAIRLDREAPLCARRVLSRHSYSEELLSMGRFPSKGSAVGRGVPAGTSMGNSASFRQGGIQAVGANC
jgi:hypothetical protein